MSGGEVMYEENMSSWLPHHGLHEACGFGTPNTNYFSSKEEKSGVGGRVKQLSSISQQHVKSTGRSTASHGSRYTNNRASSGGPGMQAIFLDSAHKSCSGTGVFLPRRATSDHSQPRLKPACSPVLLPSRVVHALNLNVHALGLQISAQRDPKTKHRVGSETNQKKKKNESVSMVGEYRSSKSVSRAHGNACTDIFLPKEWSY